MYGQGMMKKMLHRPRLRRGVINHALSAAQRAGKA